MAQLDGVTVSVMACNCMERSLDIADGRIKHIWAVLNPDKLRPWTTG